MGRTMQRIDPFERRIIEDLKLACDLRIELIHLEETIHVFGDKEFAHDVALAYQSFVLRKKRQQNKLFKK